jgi:hypothetical protein
LAGVNTANDGNRDATSQRMWSLAAAFRFRCFAQSMDLRVNCRTVASTACDAPEGEAGKAALVGADEKREGVRQLAVEFPKELFGNGRVPRAVCVRKGNALGGKDAADAEELVAVDLFGIANLVEVEGTESCPRRRE